MDMGKQETTKDKMGCCSSNVVHPINNNIDEVGKDTESKDSPITNKQIEVIQKNWKFIEQDSKGYGLKLFGILFEQNPDIRTKFYFAMENQNDLEAIMADERLEKHATGVIDTISVAVAMLNDLTSLVPILKQLGASHARFNLEPCHFQAVGAALFWTLENALGKEFDEEARTAWTSLFTVVTGTMMAGAAEVKTNGESSM